MTETKKETKREAVSRTISDFKFVAKCVNKHEPALIPLKILGMVLGCGEIYIGEYYIKWVIDGMNQLLANPAGQNIFLEIMKLIFSVQFAYLLIGGASLYVDMILISRKEYQLRYKLQLELVELSARQDLECYEDHDYYENHEAYIRQSDTRIPDTLNFALDAVNGVMQLATVITVIVALDPFAMIVVALMVILSAIDQNKTIKYSYDRYLAEQSLNRKSDYIKRVAHHKDFASEVRIFHLKDFLMKQLNDNFSEKYSIYQDANYKFWKLKHIVQIIRTMIVTPIMLGYISYRVLTGAITIGDFAVLFSAVYGVANRLTDVIKAVDRLNFESQYFVQRIRKVFERKSKIEGPQTGKKPISSIETIEFRNVFFNYPGSGEPALRGVSFTAHPGEKIALVGRNGAGKSTMVKLLLRLYDCTDGMILVNGEDIREYDVLQLRDCCAVVIQGYHILNLSLLDNICYGQKYTETELEDALKFAELDEKVAHLPHGIDTFITKEFSEDGIELSGGESQKIALARATVREKASCMILDEPNSALDVYAEIKLNEKVFDKDNDETVLMITHRLAAAVKAEKIVLLEDGKVSATGNHEQLMQTSETYEKMFMAQAKMYLQESEDSEATIA